MRPIPTRIRITSGSTVYFFDIDGDVTRRRIRDWIEPQPTTGRQTADVRFLRNSLLIGPIVDAFGARSVGPTRSRGSISGPLLAGYLQVLHDSEAETRFRTATLPRKHITPTLPAVEVSGTEQTSSIFGAADKGDTTVTHQMFNDRPAKYYTGSAISGVFCWEAQSAADSDTHLVGYAWTGSDFEGSAVIDDSADDDAFGYDLEVHKGVLYFLGTSNRGNAASNKLIVTTAGNSWSDASAKPTVISFYPGSRLLDDGNTLWIIGQGASERIDLYKSVNAASSWTTVKASAASGQVRSVFKYRDLSNTARLMFMTENSIYWIDESNNEAVSLFTLPSSGRGAIVHGASLYIFMDAMRVLKYTQTDSSLNLIDITPGGGEGMPSGKDFGYDADGTVSLWSTAFGIYASWSGDGPTSGTLLRTLCLFWTEIDGGGWHFIFRRPNTTNDAGYSSRALFVDPKEGDLVWLGANVASNNEVRTPDIVQILKVETNPTLLSANVYETAGYVETPLVSFSPVQAQTIAWDIFLNTEAMTSGVSINPNHGTDGAAATTTALGVQESDLVTVNYGSDLGINFYTYRTRLVFAGSATVSPVLYNAEVAYHKAPDARYMYVLDILIRPTGENSQPKQLISNLETLENIKTKVKLNYSEEVGDLNVFPIAESSAREILGAAGDLLGTRRSGTWRLFLAEL